MFMQKKSFVNWVNKEVEKRLDDKPFSSLPLKTRVGIFLLLIAFIGGYGLSGLFAFLGINKKSAAGISGGFLSYAISWIIGFVGLNLAGKDCIKYPRYFLAKFLKKMFPAFFEEVCMEGNNNKKEFYISPFSRLTSITILLSIFTIILYIFIKKIFILTFIPGIFLLYMILFTYGMFSVKSNFFFYTIKGRDFFRNEENCVLLRFDDGPDPFYTNKILDVLKSKGIKAMFAITGKNAEKYPDVVKRIYNEGHIIANHTYSHPFNILLMSYKDVYNEIKRTNDIIYSITGVVPEYFCPTIGHKNHIIGRVIEELKLIPVMWDIRSIDTYLSERQIVKRIKKRLKPSTIILFHDAATPLSKKNRNNTLAALVETIKLVKERNLFFYNKVDVIP